jgi:hypothetical protein
MSTTDDAQIPEWPHKPAPPEQRRIIPEWPMLSRGLGMAATAVTLIAAIAFIARKSAPVAVALGPVLGAAGFLFAWAAAIHLSGGERFDDHPWV